MAVLRVVDRRVGDVHRVSVSWQGPGTAPHDSEVTFGLSVDGAESEKVRWYLEDFAEFPTDPAPVVAREAESVLASVGRELFGRVFSGASAAAWTRASSEPGGLAGLRFEVDADPTDVPGLPWELLREPETGAAVVLGAAESWWSSGSRANPCCRPLRAALRWASSASSEAPAAR